MITAGKQRSGMTIGSHSENDNIEGCNIFRIWIFKERNELGSGGKILQKIVPNQPGVGARTGFRHLTVVNQGDRYLAPGDIDAGEGFKKQLRRGAAGNRKAGAALGSHMVLQGIGHIGCKG